VNVKKLSKREVTGEKGEGKKDILSSGNPFESVPKYQLYSLNRSSVRWDEVISADVIGK